jgi:hypothetical protein
MTQAQPQEQEAVSRATRQWPYIEDYGSITEEDENTYFIVLNLEEQCAYARAVLDYLGMTFADLEAKHAERDMTGVEQHAWFWAKDVHELMNSSEFQAVARDFADCLTRVLNATVTNGQRRQLRAAVRRDPWTAGQELREVS